MPCVTSPTSSWRCWKGTLCSEWCRWCLLLYVISTLLQAENLSSFCRSGDVFLCKQPFSPQMPRYQLGSNSEVLVKVPVFTHGCKQSKYSWGYAQYWVIVDLVCLVSVGSVGILPYLFFLHPQLFDSSPRANSFQGRLYPSLSFPENICHRCYFSTQITLQQLKDPGYYFCLYSLY